MRFLYLDKNNMFGKKHVDYSEGFRITEEMYIASLAYDQASVEVDMESLGYMEEADYDSNGVLTEASLKGAWEKIKSWFKKIANFFKKYWNKFWNWLKGIFGKKNKEVEDLIKKMKDDEKITATVSSYTVALSNSNEMPGKDALDMIPDIANKVTDCAIKTKTKQYADIDVDALKESTQSLSITGLNADDKKDAEHQFTKAELMKVIEYNKNFETGMANVTKIVDNITEISTSLEGVQDNDQKTITKLSEALQTINNALNNIKNTCDDFVKLISKDLDRIRAALKKNGVDKK